jgi:branched-chain amino acid transport system ATP-binding protein
VLELNNVSKHFGGLCVFEDINLKLDANPESPKIIGLIGPNGAGKTTLFNVLTGYLKPDQGTIILNGQKIVGKHPSEIAKLGLVRTFQQTSVFRSMTVFDNIKTGCHLNCSSGFFHNYIVPLLSAKLLDKNEKEATSKAEELMELFGLEKKKNVKATALPYGEQKRLGLAIAMAATPQILALDEPAAGLNPVESETLQQTLLKICKMGTNILLIEHDMRLVMGMCDYIYVLALSKILAQGKPEEVHSNPEVISVYLGEGVKTNELA